MIESFIKLTNTTFIRPESDYIYLFNQITYNELYLDKDSEDFISVLTKIPQKFDDLINQLYKIYDIDRGTLITDFSEFISELVDSKFVITANTIEELKEKEPVFTYKNWNIEKANVIKSNNEETQSENINIIPKDIDAANELFIENLYLEITRRCNEHCVHCYIPEEQRATGSFMSIDNAKKYLDQAKELNVWKISITGGEPFLNKDINDIILYAREKDFLINILSNLTVIKQEHIDVLKKSYIYLIQVSLYSLIPEVHDKITGLKGSFNKTFNNIKLCIENDIPIQINCPVLSINKNDYQAVQEWGFQQGIKVNVDFNILAQTDNKKTNLNYILNQQEIKDTYKFFIKDNNIDLKSFFNFNNNVNFNEPTCEAAKDELFITATGTVKPCSVWAKEIGDLKQISLKDIYYNSKETKQIRGITKSNYKDIYNSELLPFIKICPAHFANTNNGNYKTIPETDIINAKLKLEAIKELLKENN